MSIPLRNLALATALILVMAAGAVSVSAQPAPRGGGWAGMDRHDPEWMEQRGQEMFDRMCEFLELDESQQKQVRELFDSRREEMKEMFEQSREQKADRKDARDKMRENFQQNRIQFESLLTEQQLARLKEWESRRDERREKWMDMRGKRVGDDLNLNDSQREQFEKLSDEHRDNLHSLRDRIKDESLEREAARELLDSERKRFRESLSGVLSDEQLEKLDRRHMERPRFDRDRRPGMHAGMHDRPGMEGPEPGMRPGRPGKFEPMGGVLFGLRRNLDLTEEQVKQLHLITGEAIDGLFDKFAATLDLEQQEKLKEMRARIQDRRDMHRGAPPGE